MNLRKMEELETKLSQRLDEIKTSMYTTENVNELTKLQEEKKELENELNGLRLEIYNIKK